MKTPTKHSIPIQRIVIFNIQTLDLSKSSYLPNFWWHFHTRYFKSHIVNCLIFVWFALDSVVFDTACDCDCCVFCKYVLPFEIREFFLDLYVVLYVVLDPADILVRSVKFVVLMSQKWKLKKRMQLTSRTVIVIWSHAAAASLSKMYPVP